MRIFHYTFFLPVCLAMFASSALAQGALEGIASGKTKIIDLSYAINDKLVSWPGDPKVFESKTNGTIEKDGYFTRSFWMLEHYGTHLDAPAHFPPGKLTVEQIAPEKFFGPAVVLDIRVAAEKNADYQLSTAIIESWEKRHGRIPAGAIVILRTGWASRWPDVQRYRNTDAKGAMHFPGFSMDAAKILLDRKIGGIGCDTLSIDRGNSTDFPVHHLVLGANVYQLENLRDLDALPEAGAFLIVAPIKLEGGSGGAVRVFALVSGQS